MSKRKGKYNKYTEIWNSIDYLPTTSQGGDVSTAVSVRRFVSIDIDGRERVTHNVSAGVPGSGRGVAVPSRKRADDSEIITVLDPRLAALCATLWVECDGRTALNQERLILRTD
jgi:hypothetical protein